jgi:transketolase
MSVPSSKPLEFNVNILRDKATRLRIDSVRATTAAGSGHPTSCASAADIVSTLFYSVMRYYPTNPRARENDAFVLSKGHAAPLLYAAWAEAGFLSREDLLNLRKIDSDLEGHPTPRLPFVDVATGSLGQGLSAGVGLALAAKLDHAPQRVYVLMGDGESAEGSNWEAAQWAAMNRLDNLCVTIDINRLGQSQPTMLESDLKAYVARWEAFGWWALTVDGHSLPELAAAYETALAVQERPTVVLAQTIKGKGLIGIEGADGWHGKALDAELAGKVVKNLEQQLTGAEADWRPNYPPAQRAAKPHANGNGHPAPAAKPPYSIGGQETATRKGFGDGLAALAKSNPKVVAIDGDVKNSTHTDEFEKAAAERFFQGYIAEQNMVGMAMGLAARDRIPFVSTFASFLTRAHDFIRMAAISKSNIKLIGTHAGVSIGEDGPSQMGLEDLAMFAAQPDFMVLYPADATSAWRATQLIAETNGPAYIRAGRPAAPVLYGPDERFSAGKCKLLRSSKEDRALIVAAGVTVFEALAAHDELLKKGIRVRVIDLFSVRPIDQGELIASARAAGGIVITVEDHYEHGGIGDAVISALALERVEFHKLAVREIAHSGKPKELLDKYGISAKHVVQAVLRAVPPERVGKKPPENHSDRESREVKALR